MQEDDILCGLYADLMSDYSDNESLDSDSDSDSDVPTSSSHKQLQSSNAPLTPKFPHTFFSSQLSRQFL